MKRTRPKIFPRNLTARAAYEVPGNPAITRPEDAPANCYPGLDLDVRNLDRRFFPGLVFEFVARDDISAPYTEPTNYGARLLYIDDQLDPELLADTQEARTLSGQISRADALREGRWYLEWIKQRDKTLSMRFPSGQMAGTPLDGLFVWRIVRGLEQGRVTICLQRRLGPDEKPNESDAPKQVILEGWRRRFTDATTGVLSGAFQPGELTQSLCSPWQHDFRDCACHYWASNRPDVVFGEVFPGLVQPEEDTRTVRRGRIRDVAGAHTPRVDPADVDAWRRTTRVDWMRAQRARELTARAFNSIPKNRPYQLDHFEINRAWRSLNIVLDDTEIGSLYIPQSRERANPYASPEELASALREELAPLEMALAIEYLYARFSLLDPDTVGLGDQALADFVRYARYSLLLAATSEMQHLRWANELLWDLYRANLISTYEPVLISAKKIPRGDGVEPRDRELRVLGPAVLDDFIAVEHPSGTIHGKYARVVATLRSDPYPARMRDLAERIISDGVEHEGWFLDLRALVDSYPDVNPPYLRPLRRGTKQQAAAALNKFADVIEALKKAYVAAAQHQLDDSAHQVAEARAAMVELLRLGEDLAAQGIGIPFP